MIFSVQAKNKMADSKQILQRRAVGAAKRVKGQDKAGFAAVDKWHATRKLYVTRDTRMKAQRHRGLTKSAIQLRDAARLRDAASGLIRALLCHSEASYHLTTF